MQKAFCICILLALKAQNAAAVSRCRMSHHLTSSYRSMSVAHSRTTALVCLRVPNDKPHQEQDKASWVALTTRLTRRCIP